MNTTDNPMGTDGFEFVEYTAPDPELLRSLFERMGLPHTESVHLVEYFRRPAVDLVEYRFVMEDPATYEAPVEGRLNLLWREGEELFEYVCQQSNYAHDLMVNPQDLLAIGRTSNIVP